MCRLQLNVNTLQDCWFYKIVEWSLTLLHSDQYKMVSKYLMKFGRVTYLQLNVDTLKLRELKF